MEAKALAEQFAAVSFGDPLFGAVVAVLLRREVPQDIQVCKFREGVSDVRVWAAKVVKPRCRWGWQGGGVHLVVTVQ